MYSITTQPLRTAGMAVFPYSESIEAMCTFETKYEDVINMSFRLGNLLMVPRQMAPVGVEDFRKVYPAAPVTAKHGPRGVEQAQLIAASYEFLSKGVDHIFEAPTGFGKTYCGCAIAARMGQPTLIVVPKEDLVHEWTKTLVNLIGVDPKDIGYIQQDTCNYKGKKFVIGMVHSMVIEGRYPAEVYAAFGMMIVDEVHRMGADSFIKICEKVSARYRLGLSATCYRSDGKWRMVEAHIGKALVVGTTVPMSPKVLVKKTGWKIPMVKRFVDGSYQTVPIPHSAGRLMGVYKAMATDVNRNALIVEFVKQAYDSGRTIVVMADIIDHLTNLYQLVLTHVPATEMAYYIGKSSEAERKAAKETKRVIFATYKMCAEGTDAPRWDTLVMASPRSDVKQSIGRVMRTMEGKKVPVVFDLVDDAQLLQGYARSRQKQYFEVQSTLVNV
jgi:superfamily II DNA or RNA helicase